MAIFLLDTSTKCAILSLVQQGKVKKTLLLSGDASLSTTIHFHLQSFLAKEEGISKILVGLGPGSFTGTRVGIVIAKTLAYAKNLPIAGFCSLELAGSHKKDTMILSGKSFGAYLFENGLARLEAWEALEKPGLKGQVFYSLDPDPVAKKAPQLQIEKRQPNPLFVAASHKDRCKILSPNQSMRLEPIYLENL